MKPLLLALSLILAIQPAIYSESYDSSVQVQENLSSTTTWDGASIHYPPGTAKVAGAIVTLAPGAETGWHSHPVPCLALILAGELLVELKNGQTKKFKAGENLRGGDRNRPQRQKHGQGPLKDCGLLRWKYGTQKHHPLPVNQPLPTSRIAATQ